MNSDSLYQVQFQPTGKRIHVPVGCNLLEAARRAGIEITSDCGGEGTCGQCQVVVLRGSVSPPQGNETFALSELDLHSGRRLACSARVQSDLVVEVPKESTLTGQRLQIESSLAAFAPDPLVRAYTLDLARATLSDARSDLSRVRDALRDGYTLEAPRAVPGVIRQISTILREHGWRVTVFVRGAEIVGAAMPGARAIGYCVDLGTTKIAAALVDLESGQVLASAGAPNPQVGYGEDVISRINTILRSPSNAGLLAEKVRAALQDLLAGLLDGTGLPAEQVVEGCIVGNTVMIHLLLELPVRQLAGAPYVAAASDALEVRADELGLRMAPGASVYIPPGIGGFIGSDHTAMMLACEIDRAGQVTLGIDIGTNTEIVLRKPGGDLLSSASCASGPAFEGAHIAEGMRAAAGAIDKVKITRDGVELSTIQNELPVGLCGSGIIDAAAELHRCGLINRHGSFDRQNPRVREGQHGGEFLLAPAASSATGRDITIDQKDINEIQLAKGAIQAGLRILLEVNGATPADVREVIIAGAFGSYLNIEHAAAIGLFPHLPNARFRQVGNAALAGAVGLLISAGARQRAGEIQRAARYQELTTYPRFTRIFAQAMLFPEKE